MTHAYVKSQNCIMPQAFRPTDEYEGKPVADHGDLSEWIYNEAETIRMAQGIGISGNAGRDLYEIRCARAVCRLLDWDYEAGKAQEAVQ